jgi:putative flippase GtrA
MSVGDGALAAVQAHTRSLVAGERIGRFAAVGVLGTICDFLVLAGLHGGPGVGLELAKLVAAEVAVVVMFLGNDYWTFASHGGGGVRARVRRFLVSNGVRATGTLLAVLTLSLAVRWLGMGVLVANLLGVAVGGAVNYVFESLITWRVMAADA